MSDFNITNFTGAPLRARRLARTPSLDSQAAARAGVRVAISAVMQPLGQEQVIVVKSVDPRMCGSLALGSVMGLLEWGSDA